MCLCVSVCVFVCWGGVVVKSSHPLLGKHTLWSRWTAASQLDRYFSYHQLVVLVIAGEFFQAGKCFLDTRKNELLILNNEAVLPKRHVDKHGKGDVLQEDVSEVRPIFSKVTRDSRNL